MKNRSYIVWFFFSLIVVGILVIAFSGLFQDGRCSQRFRLAEPETRIVIYHVNDIHGEIGNFPKIAWIINQEKRENPNVYFLCAGDNFSGNPYVDRSTPRGKPILELMNHLGCDAQLLGNHDFDYGQATLNGYMAKARFPVICANIKVESGELVQPEPFVSLKKFGGIKIAVLGVIQISRDTGIPDTNPENVRGLKFEDGLATALKYRYLKDNFDILIALTHMGFERDKKLAARMKELDIIIGGHSHTMVDKDTWINDVLIAQTGSRNKFLGRIDLKLNNGKIVERKSTLIDLEKISSEDLKTKEMVESYTRIPELDQVIATFTERLEGDQVLGNLLTDAIRRTLNLDVAFYNTGGIRIHSLGETVRLRDVYAIDPFDNEIIIFELIPEEIRSLIRFDYKNIGPLDLQVSGLVYTVLADQDRRIIAVKLETESGAPLDEAKKYSVGINNYMASVYRFEHLDPGRSAYMKVVDALISFLKNEVNLITLRNAVRKREEIIR